MSKNCSELMPNDATHPATGSSSQVADACKPDDIIEATVEVAVEAIIGLGSNMGDKIGNLDLAIVQLATDPEIKVVARSRKYRSAPWGVTDQDWFVNACVVVKTTLSPHALLDRCQRIETTMGRVRRQRWGARVIDVDILTYGRAAVQTPDLVIPHPLIAQRGFVLLPLRDVAVDLVVAGRTLDDMIAALDTRDVTPIN